MKRIILVISVAFLVFSCSQKEEAVQELNAGDKILGLASPIKLGPDTTDIFLLDYFEKAELIDTLWFSGEVRYSFDRNTGIASVFENSSSTPVINLAIQYDGLRYDIPVFKSKKIKHSYNYSTDETDLVTVGLKGNFNGWNASANPLSKGENGWSTQLTLEPGLYEYLIVQNGKEMLDPNNPNKKDNGMGGFNSVMKVGDAADHPHIATQSFTTDSIFIFYPDSLETPLVYWENVLLGEDLFGRNKSTLAIPSNVFDSQIANSSIRIFGMSGATYSNDLLIPLENSVPVEDASSLTRSDKHTWSMYFMMVDRFVNGNEENDQPVQDPEILPPANYYGGDIPGVSAKVDDGYFSELGINTVWLSPIGQNPLGAYGLWDKGGVRSKFSGYHGYWPTSSTKVDFRMGTDKDLNNLIDSAHAHEMNIILDYVANHVHEEHPVYQMHPDWATDLYLPDGSLNTEKWDEHRLTTWFDTFMPTLDLRKDEVVEAMTDSALYWFQTFEIDGFRHDATKHIPLKFWRELTRKLKYEVMLPQDRAIYQIGETYGNPELIGSYIGSGMLDAQFDFNLYDAAVSAFAKDDGSCLNLQRVLEQSLNSYGYHHLMGNISGNQDRTRFISFADGAVDFSEDYKLAGWTRKITIQDTIGYSRLALLHALNFSIPGIPVIYYGDEIGMPGANDPDNRRMMRFGNDLSEQEQELLGTVSSIAHLRSSKMAFLYGDTEILYSSENALIISRSYFDETAIICINTSGDEKTLDIQLPEYYTTDALSSNFNQDFQIQGSKFLITLPPVSFDILTN